MPTVAELPDALERHDELAARLTGRPVAVFLDYDGVLTPIVPDPGAAVLDPEMRDAVRRLAEVATTAIVSGRDAGDVRDRVALHGLVYAGSHGFDVVAADGTVIDDHRGRPYLPALDAAERRLRAALAQLPGVTVERKRFAITAHYRNALPAAADAVRETLVAVTADDPRLRTTGGKQIVELRPNVDWHKGRAVLALLATLADDVVPLYVGDDVTDEDAFVALAGVGIGVVVHGEDDDRPTSAGYALADTAAVRDLIVRLTDIARRGA